MSEAPCQAIRSCRCHSRKDAALRMMARQSGCKPEGTSAVCVSNAFSERPLAGEGGKQMKLGERERVLFSRQDFKEETR